MNIQYLIFDFKKIEAVEFTPFITERIFDDTRLDSRSFLLIFDVLVLNATGSEVNAITAVVGNIPFSPFSFVPHAQPLVSNDSTVTNVSLVRDISLEPTAT